MSLYETAEDAKRSLAHELRPDVIRAASPVANLRFFSVPGIPGARGWTASLPGEPASPVVGNELWVRHDATASSTPNRTAPSPTRSASSESCVGEHCSPEPIAFYVNGKPYQQDPRAIELTDRKEIAIVIGTPPSQIPKTAEFSKA